MMGKVRMTAGEYKAVTWLQQELGNVMNRHGAGQWRSMEGSAEIQKLVDALGQFRVAAEMGGKIQIEAEAGSSG